MALSIYCDGSSHDRAGWPGGWAFCVLAEGAVWLERTGADRATTNNLMELMAALAGLREVVARGWHLGTAVELVSDSRFVLDIAAGVALPRKHVDQALELRAACLQAGATTRWVRAHSGEKWNEHVDALAHEARQTLVPARVKKRAARLVAVHSARRDAKHLP